MAKGNAYKTGAGAAPMGSRENPWADTPGSASYSGTAPVQPHAESYGDMMRRRSETAADTEEERGGSPEWLYKHMQRRDFAGGAQSPQYNAKTPEEMTRRPTVGMPSQAAINRVEGADEGRWANPSPGATVIAPSTPQRPPSTTYRQVPTPSIGEQAGEAAGNALGPSLVQRGNDLIAQQSIESAPLESSNWKRFTETIRGDSGEDAKNNADGYQMMGEGIGKFIRKSRSE